MAEAGLEFYRDVARAGYRGAYLQKLADDVASGSLDLERLNDPEIPSMRSNSDCSRSRASAPTQRRT
jgi:3-methyladenine DNA glycosylase/8-oxoguanine DNA glycosylase